MSEICLVWKPSQFFNERLGVSILEYRSDCQGFSESGMRQSLKEYLRRTARNSPVEQRMSEVAAKIFEESLNKVVLVQLKGGRTVRGRLYSFDQHMNLVLEDAEDVTNAELTKKLGTIIVRGDNVVLVSPPPKR
jgi:small nuclear ribonucleoprotein